MAAFVSEEISLSAATATKIVDSESFDRVVTAYGDAVRLAYTSGTVSTGARLSGSELHGGTSFVLPANQELWAYHSGGTTVGFLTSNVL